MTKQLLGSLELNRIYQQDCIEGMKLMPDGSIDMILCDLPYGTTACKWDTIIPFEPLWEQYERIIKDNGAIVLTAVQPFTSALVMSNAKRYKHSWVWNKVTGRGHLVAKYRPLQQTEDIIVFSKGRVNYYPQMVERPKNKIEVGREGNRSEIMGGTSNGYRKTYTHWYPKNIITISNASSSKKSVHPTQKPVDLFRYLIRTYTKPGEIVLDNCMGSGTTAVAATIEGRSWIGFETEREYVEIANKRLDSLEIPAN